MSGLVKQNRGVSCQLSCQNCHVHIRRDLVFGRGMNEECGEFDSYRSAVIGHMVAFEVFLVG